MKLLQDLTSRVLATWRHVVVALSLCCATTVVYQPRACADNWVGGTGDWNVGTNWNLGVVPNGVDAIVNNGGTAQIGANAPNANDIRLGDGGGTSGIVQHSAGNITVNQWLRIATGGGTGDYQLSGGALTVQNAVNIGESGAGLGQFNHTGGTFHYNGNNGDADRWLQLGRSGATSNGSYNLSGSTATSVLNINSGRIIVGREGIGVFTQTGGTVNHIGATDYLGIGDAGSSTGTYNMQGGVLNAQGAGTSGVLVGWNGNATFNHSGGTVNADRVNIRGNGGSGAYNFSGGNLNVVTSAASIFSQAGGGVFNFTGGTLKVVNYNLGTLVQQSSNAHSNLDVTSNSTTISGGYDITAENINGAELNLGAGNTLQVNGAFNPNTGTVTVNQTGGTFNTTAWFNVSNGSATTVYSLSGGSINPGTDFNVTDQGGNGTLNQSGTGAINVTGGNYFVGKDSTSVGVLNHSGGTTTISVGRDLRMSAGGASTGTYNLNAGGLLITPNVMPGGGNSTFNFNGGTLRANQSNASYMQGLTATNVQNGGAIVDTNGFNVTIAQPLLNGGTGGLTKNGAGTLTLSSTANTYLGDTTVNAGTLDVTGALPSNSFFDVFQQVSLDSLPGNPLLKRRVGPLGNNYTGIGSTSVGGLNTTVELLGGTNSSGSDTNVDMQFRLRTASESTAPTSPPLPGLQAPLLSNVLSLTGMVNSGAASGQTDPFVLQLSYDPSLLQNEASSAAGGSLYLAWLDPGAGPLWENAILGNFGANSGVTNFQGSWLAAGSPLTPGAWGVDIASDKVWAVVNHNSEFAVIPEPGTFAMAACGFVILMTVLRKRHH